MKNNEKINNIKKRLGTGFRNARESLGLTATDIAGELRSKSSMSDFENGKGELPVALFYFFIEKMRITFDEFEFLANNYELSGFRKTWFESMKACADNDEKSVKLWLDRSEWNVKEGVYDRYDHLMLKHIVSIKYPLYALSSGEKNKIITHLTKTNDWRNSDLILYANTLTAFDVKVVKKLSKMIVDRTSFYKAIPENKRLIAQILINTITVLLDGGDIPTAIGVKNQIKDLLTDTDAHERISFLFTCGMIDYYRGEKAYGMEQMEEAINIFRRIGSIESAERCQNNYNDVIDFFEN